MVLRQLAKVLLPNLERDVTRSVSKELAAMDELVFLAAKPRIFSYQKSQGVTGAFGRTGMIYSANEVNTNLILKSLPMCQIFSWRDTFMELEHRLF